MNFDSVCINSSSDIKIVRKLRFSLIIIIIIIIIYYYYYSNCFKSSEYNFDLWFQSLWKSRMIRDWWFESILLVIYDRSLLSSAYFHGYRSPTRCTRNIVSENANSCQREDRLERSGNSTWLEWTKIKLSDCFRTRPVT